MPELRLSHNGDSDMLFLFLQQKEKVTNQQRINFYLDQIQSRCNEAINLYTDKEGYASMQIHEFISLLNNEIENMKQDSLQSFLKKLDDIQKYYTRNPDLEEGPVCHERSSLI